MLTLAQGATMNTFNRSFRSMLLLSALILAPACTRPPESRASTETAGMRDVERVRAATARFRDLNESVSAGYPAEVAQCFDNPPEGGMGYHHVHQGLLDARIEVEKPEILVYERGRDGGYTLVGVEYAVPIDAWKSEDPPSVMGQSMKRAPSLGIWYLHVWVWRENPKGLFADWNPAVACPAE